MIKSYQVEQNLNTTDGTTASISFGLRADGVPIKIAHEIESEFSKFLGRVTGGSATMAQCTTRTLEWAPEETGSIKDCTSIAEARRKYREAFPELRKKPVPTGISAGGLSVATADPEDPPARKEVVAMSKKTAPAKKPAGKNKYEIPFSAMTEKNEYQNAINLCKKYKKPYPEALKLKEAADAKWREEHPGKPTKSEQASKNARSKTAKVSKKTVVKKERLPYKMKNRKPEEVPTPSGETPETTAPSIDDPQPPAAIEPDQTISPLKVGDTVRQIAGFPAWHGVGIVKRAPPDRPLEALVGFENGQSWCLRKNLRRTMAGEAV